MLDLEEVRQAYYHPPPEDPERIPTREEIYAERERLSVETCLRLGFTAEQMGLGEHGSLIGGPSKPLSTGGFPPERIARLWPLPLTWFDYPLARRTYPPPGGEAEAYRFLYALSADHLAGVPQRPDGGHLMQILRSDAYTPRERMQIWHIFACIRMADLIGLLSRAGLSIFEIAQAVHLSETTRASVCTWINYFAVPPDEQDLPDVRDPDSWQDGPKSAYN